MLQKDDQVVIPTDKTNSIKVVKLLNYIKQVQEHLHKQAIEITRDKIVILFQQASALAEKLDSKLSIQEAAFLQEGIQSKAIPTPKLLIKDHKKPDNQSNFPTRLVIPATNFTATYSKLGYKALKAILDENEVKYNRFTITQASSLKEELEKLKIDENKVKIASIEVVNMYPSVRLSLIKRAVKYFTLKCDPETKQSIKLCLKLIEFGMNSTLITFRGKYYEYSGAGDATDKGLAIGGYESAFLADLVASYLFEKTKRHFAYAIYNGIYRDDGFLILNGKRNKSEMIDWLKDFQATIDALTRGDYFKFTATIWDRSAESSGSYGPLEISNSPSLPFLDMNIAWSNSGNLSFSVYRKPGQELKYLNHDSTHTKATSKSIPNGVLTRLSRLTSITDENKDTKMDILYPSHAEALSTAGLAPKIYPTLGEVRKKDLLNKVAKEKRKLEHRSPSSKGIGRTTYFCIAYSKFWKEKIHSRIKKLKKAYGLTWLRVSMAYSRFPNLREIFQGDLSKKLTDGLLSLDLMDRPCNCNKNSRCPTTGLCAYKGNCRRKCIVYEVTCKLCNNCYVGNTQQTFKDRMNGHFNDVQKLVCKKVQSDSFARHFAKHFTTKPSPKKLRDILDFEVLWAANPISAVRSFGKLSCSLCMAERLKILSYTKNKTKNLMNACSEIYGACRHKPRFHRFPSTDERIERERVPLSVSPQICQNIPGTMTVKNVHNLCPTAIV